MSEIRRSGGYANIVAGTIDGTVIGGTTPAAGTFTGVNVTGLTASRGVVTDASKNLTSDDAATGTGAPVRATSPTVASPTITGTVTLGDAAKYLWDILPAVSGTASGDITSETVSGAVTALNLVYASTAGPAKADADSYTTMPVIGMALETKTDAACQILRRGAVYNSAWTWTVGGLLYADTTDGGLTQTAPSGQNDCVQIVGYAISATVAWIDPSPVVTEIGLDVVTVSSADAAITVSSLTSVPVQYHVTTGNSDRTLTIDAMSAADIGKGIEIYKVDPGGSGKVIVTAPAGVYFVNSAGASTAGGTITSEASKYQMVSLRFISATLIQIKYTDGTWTKSS